MNDLVDFKVDKERVAKGMFQETAMSVEGTVLRHPMAQGELSYRSGLFWAVFWGILAIIGGFLLNPVCVLIFLAGGALEALYCKMLRISPARTLVQGIVKSMGSMAAIFAVWPEPSPVFVAAVFFWMYFWEIGGQNIAADWHDIKEDRILKAQTVPQVLGVRAASVLIMLSLGLSITFGYILFAVAPARPGWLAYVLLTAAGLIVLVLPGLRLLKTGTREMAGWYFSVASYYPPVVFVIVLLSVLFGI